MSYSSIAELARKLKPYFADWFNQAVGAGSGGAITVHELGGLFHSGTLLDDQAPQFLMVDGSRELTGNLAVADSVTIDGIDLSALGGQFGSHLNDPSAHHEPVRIGTGGLSAKLGLVGQVLTLGAINHADLSGIGANDHHSQAHAIAGADHTASGLIAGQVLRATEATTFAWAQLQHSDLGGVSANQHHSQVHTLAGSDHTASGLTTGHVLRATGATTFGWGQAQHADLGGVSADQHHVGFVGLEDSAGTSVVPAADDRIQLKAGDSILAITAGANLVTFTVNQAGIDHGSIGGLSDDDHIRYAEHAGVETITGAWQWSISLLPSATDTYDLGSSVALWRKGWLSELESVLFVQNSVQVTGGWWMVPHASGTLAADVSEGQTQIDFGSAMAQGDFVLLRGNGEAEYLQVGTLVGGTTYNVTRDHDGTGANAWPRGHVWVNLGNLGDGRIEFDAQTAGPRVSLFEQGNAYNVQTERVRIGDLSGWGEAGLTGYGWAVGDYAGGEYAYYAPAVGLVVSGKVTASEGQIGGWTVLSTKLHNTNIWLDAAARQIAIGSQTFGADGIQLEYNAGNPRAYIGDGSTRYLKFDGTTITWKTANTEVDASGNLIATSATLSGTITATAGTIGGFTVSSSDGLYAGTGATRVQMQPGAGFWAGADARDSAPFRVTAAGALTATSATITGVITATSGAFTGKITMSGTSSALAIGATPPTSATAGTGIWIDRTGFYSLSSGIYQVKIDAISGKLNAGGGNLMLDSLGMMLNAPTVFTGGAAIKWGNLSTGETLVRQYGYSGTTESGFVTQVGWSSGSTWGEIKIALGTSGSVMQFSLSDLGYGATYKFLGGNVQIGETGAESFLSVYGGVNVGGAVDPGAGNLCVAGGLTIADSTAAGAGSLRLTGSLTRANYGYCGWVVNGTNVKIKYGVTNMGTFSNVTQSVLVNHGVTFSHPGNYQAFCWVSEFADAVASAMYTTYEVVPVSQTQFHVRFRHNWGTSLTAYAHWLVIGT